jgi:hypothetical protein
VLLDRAHVVLLALAARLDDRAAQAHDAQRGDFALAGGFGRGQVLDAGLLQAQVHLVRREFEVACRLVVEMDDHRARGNAGLLRALHHEVVAAVADADAEALFDEMKVLVELTAQPRQAARVAGLEDEL